MAFDEGVSIEKIGRLAECDIIKSDAGRDWVVLAPPPSSTPSTDIATTAAIETEKAGNEISLNSDN